MNHLKISTAHIAKICNVSQGTVDRALNDRADISAETKNKILAVAKKYGYRKSIPQKAIEFVGQVGVIVFNLNNEYFSRLITELEDALRRKGYNTIVMMTHYDKEREIECIRNMYNAGVCGIVLCSVNKGREFENYLKLFDVPIVAVGNDIGSVPYVGIDDFTAMQEITRKIINDGYKNLIYYSPAIKYTDAYAQKLRYEGFLSAAYEVDYQVAEDISQINESYDDRTAVICSTDYYAFQVYLKCRDVKITGFDNLDTIRKYALDIDSVEYSVSQIANDVVDVITGVRKTSSIVEHKIKENKK